ncbi:MAG: hypothetical protein ACK5PC_16840 [Cyclobacteriaceae bacterium]|jgi:hypothetical protein
MKTALLSFLILRLGMSAVAQVKDSVQISTEAAREKIKSLDSAQQQLKTKLDSLQLPVDSTARAAVRKAEAIRNDFQTKTDSLQRAYQQPINQLNERKASLQQKIDSLHRLQLPTDKYTSKLDSVNRLSTAKTAELMQKVDALKDKATKNLKDLQLPAELQGQTAPLEQAISKFNIPMVNGKIPDVGINNPIPGVQLPGMSVLPSGTPSIPVVNGVGGNPVNIPGAPVGQSILDVNQAINPTQQLGEYGKDVQAISKGELPDAKSIENKAENELNKSGQMKEITGQNTELDKYKKQLGSRPDSAMLNMAKDQVKTEAINHFAGKEEVLKGAMEKMAKLKSRYSEVKSMADLPKRLPNPLKGKPLIERLVPALSFQIINEKNILLDINPSIAYKIYPKWKAGLGWVERITFNQWTPKVSERVYGFRTYNEVSLPKRFQVRGDIELVNAFIPPLLLNQTELAKRDWEWNIIVGFKKDFKVYKSIKGNVQTMYRVWSDHDKAPYPDRLMVRIGFEFPMRKKVKK